MRITFDKEVDAAYIYLKDKIGKGEVKSTISLNEDIILDFDDKKTHRDRDSIRQQGYAAESGF